MLPKILASDGVYSFFNGLAPDNIFFHMVYNRCVVLRACVPTQQGPVRSMQGLSRHGEAHNTCCTWHLALHLARLLLTCRLVQLELQSMGLSTHYEPVAMAPLGDDVWQGVRNKYW